MADMNGNALTSAASPWWAKLLDRFGVPTIMLAVVLWSVYQTSWWLAENVLKPVTNGHIQLLETVQQQGEEQTDVLKELLHEQHVTTQSSQKIAEQNQESAQMMQRLMSQQTAELLKAVETMGKNIHDEHEQQMQRNGGPPDGP